MEFGYFLIFAGKLHADGKVIVSYIGPGGSERHVWLDGTE